MESSSVPTRPRFARDAIWHSNLKIISVGLSISIQEIHGWGLEDADWLYLIVHCPNITSEFKKKGAGEHYNPATLIGNTDGRVRKNAGARTNSTY